MAQGPLAGLQVIKFSANDHARFELLERCQKRDNPVYRFDIEDPRFICFRAAHERPESNYLYVWKPARQSSIKLIRSRNGQSGDFICGLEGNVTAKEESLHHVRQFQILKNGRPGGHRKQTIVLGFERAPGVTRTMSGLLLFSWWGRHSSLERLKVRGEPMVSLAVLRVLGGLQ